MKNELFLSLIVSQLLIYSCYLVAQPGINFYPYHKGDIRQYRSMYTGNIIYTDYTDSVNVDSLSKDTFIFGRDVSSSTNPVEWRIDSLGNLYNMGYQPKYVRYKLYADSGDSWFGGYDTDTNYHFQWSVTGVSQGMVYGIYTTVKVFHLDQIYAPTQNTFWLGNDYLAAGFGLVRTDVEPSDSYYLSGAIIDTNHYGTIDDVKEKETLPRVFSLDQNYPNPFNGETIIQYKLSEAEFVQLRICDILGRSVATLVEENQYPGQYSVHFAPDNLQSGVYFYRLQAGRLTDTKKMLLVK